MNAAESGGTLLSLEPGLMIWTVITFVLLLVVLRKYAWKPILSALEDREKRVSDAMHRIEEADASMKRSNEEQKQILDKAREESSQILAEARKAAEQVRAQIVESAHSEKEKLLESAKREIEAATQAAQTELRRTAADIAIQATEKLLSEKIDAEADRRLVERTIAELKA